MSVDLKTLITIMDACNSIQDNGNTYISIVSRLVFETYVSPQVFHFRVPTTSNMDSLFKYLKNLSITSFEDDDLVGEDRKLSGFYIVKAFISNFEDFISEFRDLDDILLINPENIEWVFSQHPRSFIDWACTKTPKFDKKVVKFSKPMYKDLTIYKSLALMNWDPRILKMSYSLVEQEIPSLPSFSGMYHKVTNTYLVSINKMAIGVRVNVSDMLVLSIPFCESIRVILESEECKFLGPYTLGRIQKLFVISSFVGQKDYLYLEGGWKNANSISLAFPIVNTAANARFTWVEGGLVEAVGVSIIYDIASTIDTYPNECPKSLCNSTKRALQESGEITDGIIPPNPKAPRVDDDDWYDESEEEEKEEAPIPIPKVEEKKKTIPVVEKVEKKEKEAIPTSKKVESESDEEEEEPPIRKPTIVTKKNVASPHVSKNVNVDSDSEDTDTKEARKKYISPAYLKARKVEKELSQLYSSAKFDSGVKKVKPKPKKVEVESDSEDKDIKEARQKYISSIFKKNKKVESESDSDE